MVNAEVLQKQVSQLKMGKDAAIEYYKQLFTSHPDLQDAYGAPDPDAIGRSQRFIMLAMNELQYFATLPKNLNDDRAWRSALSQFKEHYGDVDVPLKEFNKCKEAICAVISKFAGGLSPEQKKEWEALVDKAYKDMKGYGWF